MVIFASMNAVKKIRHSTYECEFTTRAINISPMVGIVKKYKYKYEETKYRLLVAKELQRRAEYTTLTTLHLEKVADITVDSDSITP